MSKFGDMHVTVLLDMSVPLTGLETVTARGIQRLIELPGDGACSVSLQRLGVDPEPAPVQRVSASDLLTITGPMRWINWWQPIVPRDRHIVVLAVHELRDAGYVHRPSRIKLLPLALAVGVQADLVSKLSFIPPKQVLHTPIEQLDIGWEAVAASVSRLRSLPSHNDPRTVSRLEFTSSEQGTLTPKQSNAAYARKAGFIREFVKYEQRQRTLIHAR